MKAKTLVLTIGAVALAATAGTGPIVVTPLASLCDAAQVIVAGQITASPSSTQGSSSVTVSRLIKGDPGSVTIAFRWPADLDFAGTQEVYGLVFLVPDSPSGWVATPIMAGGGRITDYLFHLPAGDLPTEYSYSPEAEPLEKVVAELRHEVANDQEHPHHLASAYRGLLSLQQPTNAVISQGQLATQGSATQTSLALQTAGAGLANAIRDRVVGGLSVPSSLASLLCRVVDTDVVIPAGTLLTASTDPLTRLCAVTALRNVHSPSALSSLATALSSEDMEVAYAGLMGLSAYAIGEIPGGTGRDTSKVAPDNVVFAQSPSISVFSENPEAYLAYWRRWWQCEACRLGEQGCSQTACLGFVATYTATYDAAWTCTAAGPTGCHKNLVSAQPATYKPEPPDVAPPPSIIGATGYIDSYSANYDANWTCTSTGDTGCRKNRLSYAPATFKAVAPDAAAPPVIVYTYGYVATWSAGPWSSCSVGCGGGWQTRSISPASWKATAPHATPPDDGQVCNNWPCSYTCYDYGLYQTWAECYADWPYCDIRYRDDGTGGLLQCKHGYE